MQDCVINQSVQKILLESKLSASPYATHYNQNKEAMNLNSFKLLFSGKVFLLQGLFLLLATGVFAQSPSTATGRRRGSWGGGAAGVSAGLRGGRLDGRGARRAPRAPPAPSGAARPPGSPRRSRSPPGRGRGSSPGRIGAPGSPRPAQARRSLSSTARVIRRPSRPPCPARGRSQKPEPRNATSQRFTTEDRCWIIFR